VAQDLHKVAVLDVDVKPATGLDAHRIEKVLHHPVDPGDVLDDASCPIDHMIGLRAARDQGGR
jgi:hypothetical protein